MDKQLDFYNKDVAIAITSLVTALKRYELTAEYPNLFNRACNAMPD